MGYQPRKKSPHGAIREYKKSFREKRSGKSAKKRSCGLAEEKHAATEREIAEVTLKRLHTLGNQKFGSSPYSQHFDRWLTNVQSVLTEFESYPAINIDNQYLKECSQALSTIKRQLEDRRLREAFLGEQMSLLTDHKSKLQQIHDEYSKMTSAVQRRKSSEIKELYSSIDRLKNEQHKVIQMKTGFFLRVSKKNREQKELAIVEELNDKQTQLELTLLRYKDKQKTLREEYQKKKETVLDRIKFYRKAIQDMETDGSLEERWFACEALIDAVNSFLQRKATKPPENSS